MVLSDISLRIDRGDFLLVTGPNGGGKTTLLRCMLGLLKPTRGTVTYFDAEGNRAKRLHTGYLPQKSSVDSRFPVTVGDVVEMGLIGKSSGMGVREALAKVGLEDMAGRALGELSGGQVQRALLARAIVMRPELLVLDEPLSYLDRENRRRTFALVEELAQDTTVVVVSHELSELSAMATRTVYVDHTLE